MPDQDPWGMATATPLALLLAVIITILLVIAAVYPVQGATTKSHNNSLGVVVSQDNPFTYKVGKVIGVGAPDTGIVLRIQPLATYVLFSEDILFCDREKVVSMFVGKRNPFILTYKTRASRLIQGIGCHEMVRIDEMRDTQPWALSDYLWAIMTEKS